jgi:hypothetical protein
VTDGVHTIRTIKADKQELLTYHHYHKSNDLTRYRNYTYAPKTFAWVAFKSITSPPSKHEESPYTPHYYLKEKYNLFLDDRK